MDCEHKLKVLEQEIESLKEENRLLKEKLSSSEKSFCQPGILREKPCLPDQPGRHGSQFLIVSLFAYHFGLVSKLRILLFYSLVEQIQCIIQRSLAIEVVLHSMLELFVTSLIVCRKVA